LLPYSSPVLKDKRFCTYFLVLDRTGCIQGRMAVDYFLVLERGMLAHAKSRHFFKDYITFSRKK
jgi:hypothetical protein